jgi:hypothetical protein
METDVEIMVSEGKVLEPEEAEVDLFAHITNMELVDMEMMAVWY